jgi:hypothetical protein
MAMTATRGCASSAGGYSWSYSSSAETRRLSWIFLIQLCCLLPEKAGRPQREEICFLFFGLRMVPDVCSAAHPLRDTSSRPDPNSAIHRGTFAIHAHRKYTPQFRCILIELFLLLTNGQTHNNFHITATSQRD